MEFTPEEKWDIQKKCTRFLGPRSSQTVSERLHDLSLSEAAQLGQDFYGHGGALEEFEKELAVRLGKPAAVFMPSGTMAQQIALRIWCDEAKNRSVAFHPLCHLEIHEQGAYRELHQLEAQLLGERDRLFTLTDLKATPAKIAALLIELPQREIGGQLPSFAELEDICGWCRERGIRVHMDGARLWECGPYYQRSYAEICNLFDSVYVSFYKILGGLPGSILAGPADFIEKAKIWQRRHGGNLFTQAPNVISAKLGMERELPQMGAYCQRAAEIANRLRLIHGIKVVPEYPPTNMMHLHLRGAREPMEYALWEIARDAGVLLFRSLEPTQEPDVWKVEITISRSSMNIEAQEIFTAFSKILDAGAV